MLSQDLQAKFGASLIPASLDCVLPLLLSLRKRLLKRWTGSLISDKVIKDFVNLAITLYIVVDAFGRIEAEGCERDWVHHGL